MSSIFRSFSPLGDCFRSLFNNEEAEYVVEGQFYELHASKDINYYWEKYIELRGDYVET